MLGFSFGHWYTVPQILSRSYKTIFIDGLSFTEEELKSDFKDVRLRFYRDTEDGHMFTMCPAYV